MKFGNGAKGVPSTGVDTLIGKQTEILGDIRFSGGLHVDGIIRGKVLAEAGKAAALSLGDNGLIEGDVRVPIVMLNGTVRGDVLASERITMAEKARVTGNVYYKLIEMESGALVNGQLIHEAAPQPGTAQHRESMLGAGSDSTLDELSEARRQKGLGNG